MFVDHHVPYALPVCDVPHVLIPLSPILLCTYNVKVFVQFMAHVLSVCSMVYAISNIRFPPLVVLPLPPA